MAKQIYIDENGNEQLVSGTINNAELLPISSSDPTNTKDYIDTGLSGKADTNNFTRKSKALANSVTVAANSIDSQTFSVTDSVYGIVIGFAITNSTNFAVVQTYIEGTTLYTRVRNLANTSDSYKITVWYI